MQSMMCLSSEEVCLLEEQLVQLRQERNILCRAIQNLNNSLKRTDRYLDVIYSLTPRLAGRISDTQTTPSIDCGETHVNEPGKP